MTATLSKTVADFETTLASAVAIGATSCTLVSVTDDDGVTLAAGTYAMTVDLGNDDKEYFIGTLSGSTISGIQSITRQGVASSGFVREHRRGAKVVVTDWVIIKRLVNLLDGTTDLDSSNPLSYDGTPTLSSNNELATVGYVLSVVSGGTVNFDKQIISMTAGETIAVRDYLYFKESDSRWYKIDADDPTHVNGTRKAFAASTGTVGNAVSVQLSGLVTGFGGTLTANTKYYAGNTAGAITTTSGTTESFAGWAITTSVLFMSPDLIYTPTAKEKAAMVGTLGTPSSTNKFVTNDNTSAGSSDQSQTTANATIEFGEANTTGRKNKVAQSYVAGKTKVRGIELYKQADTGTFTGTVTVSLQADSSGSPSGSALVSVTLTNNQWKFNVSSSAIDALFSTEYSQTPGTTYWIVAECSTGDTVNHPNLGTNSAGGYSSGSVKYYNGTDNWVSVATIDLYFKVLEGVNSQNITSSTGGLVPTSFLDFTRYQVGITPYMNADWVVQHIPFFAYLGTGAAANQLLWTTGATELCNSTARLNLSADNYASTGQNVSAAAKIFNDTIVTTPGAGNSPMLEDLTVENKLILEGGVNLKGLTDGDFFFGFTGIATGVTGLNIVYNTTGANTSHAGIVIRQDGTVYLQTATASAVTATLVGSITIPFSQNKFMRIRLEWDPTSALRLYINGKLATTNTTNLPNRGTLHIQYSFNENAVGTINATILAPTIAMRFNN